MAARDPYFAESAPSAEDVSRYRVGRSLLLTVVALIVLGVFVGGATISYQLGFEAGTRQVTPIITAGVRPTKVRPDKPGGMRIPNQNRAIFRQLDLRNGNSASKGGEKLLPGGERPIESLLLTIKPATSSAAANGETKTAAKTKNDLAPPPATVPAPPPAKKTPPRRPGGPLVSKTLNLTPPSAKKPVAKTADRKAKGKTEDITLPSFPSKATVAAVPRKAPPPGKIAAPAKPIPKISRPPAPKAKAAPKKAVVASLPKAPPAIPTPRASPSAGKFLVQLSASKSEADARRKWVALVSRNPGLFNGLGRVIAKSYLGKRKGTWYRLRAGPFADRGKANQMCARAKKRKVACYVVRR